MPTQMTHRERATVDAMLRQDKDGAMGALRQINATRRRCGVEELGKWAIYRYIKGVTHGRGVPEARGRKRLLARRDVARLDQVRERLLRSADGALRDPRVWHTRRRHCHILFDTGEPLATGEPSAS